MLQLTSSVRWQQCCSFQVRRKILPGAFQLCSVLDCCVLLDGLSLLQASLCRISSSMILSQVPVPDLPLSGFLSISMALPGSLISTHQRHSSLYPLHLPLILHFLLIASISMPPSLVTVFRFLVIIDSSLSFVTLFIQSKFCCSCLSSHLSLLYMAFLVFFPKFYLFI